MKSENIQEIRIVFESNMARRGKTRFVKNAAAAVRNLMDHGGKAKSTKARRRLITAKLNEYIEASYNITLAEMIKTANESGNVNHLEAGIMGFFCDVKMDDPENPGETMPPKRNTIDGYRSHIKQHILEETKGRIDISNRQTFPEFHVRPQEFVSIAQSVLYFNL